MHIQKESLLMSVKWVSGYYTQAFRHYWSIVFMLLISVSFSITGFSDQSNTQNKKIQSLEVISIEYPPHIIKTSLAESAVFKFLDHLLKKSDLVSKPKNYTAAKSAAYYGKWKIVH
jgi:hypothetical protein